MSVWLWILVIAVMVAAPIVGGYYLARAKETGELDELNRSFDELQHELGKQLLPVLDHLNARIIAWQKRINR